MVPGQSARTRRSHARALGTRSARVAAVYPLLKDHDLKRGRRILQDRLAHLLLGEQVDRELGKRAHALFLLLDVDQDGAYRVDTIEYVRQVWVARRSPLIVSQHALARLLQRSVHIAYMPLAAVTLRPHLLRAIAEHARHGAKAMITGSSMGVLVWAPHASELVAVSWISAQTARPAWRTLCRDAGDGVAVLRD